jgi:transcriptional regulator with XRE-family HTH domain
MLSCKQASRLLSQSLDRRLTWRERTALRLHLTICDVCRRFGRQLLLLRQATRRMISQTEQDEQLQLSQEAKARIANALDLERQ